MTMQDFMQSGDPRRNTGRTSAQMKAAPEGSVFVWCNHDLHYPRELAMFVGRTDLKVVPLGWLENGAGRGRNFTGITVDYAAQLSVAAQDNLINIRAHVR